MLFIEPYNTLSLGHAAYKHANEVKGVTFNLF